ncbi:hypothetical protein HK405_016018, partial [Cladochytrium tenue]
AMPGDDHPGVLRLRSALARLRAAADASATDDDDANAHAALLAAVASAENDVEAVALTLVELAQNPEAPPADRVARAVRAPALGLRDLPARVDTAVRREIDRMAAAIADDLVPLADGRVEDEAQVAADIRAAVAGAAASIDVATRVDTALSDLQAALAADVVQLYDRMVTDAGAVLTDAVLPHLEDAVAGL